MTKRILVIDDEVAIREIIQFSLEELAGWQVLLAASGKEGLSRAAIEQPDVILLDVVMPEMDGQMTLEQLQRNPASQHIPTILLTANLQGHDTWKIAPNSVIGTISKPFTATDLVAQIRTFLNW
jgi:CheY-like chemotaxis protein